MRFPWPSLIAFRSAPAQNVPPVPVLPGRPEAGRDVVVQRVGGAPVDGVAPVGTVDGDLQNPVVPLGADRVVGPGLVSRHGAQAARAMNPAPPLRLVGMDEVDRDAMVVLVRDGQRVVLGRLGEDRCHLAAVDDLARLRLAAERFGWAVRLEGATEDFLDLLDLCGLSDLFATDQPSR